MLDFIEIKCQTTGKPTASIDFESDTGDFYLTDYERVTDPDYAPVKISEYMVQVFTEDNNNVVSY